MMKSRSSVLLTMVCLLISSLAFGNDFYVDIQNGDNLLGDGSQIKPYRNITYLLKFAEEIPQPGDTIFLYPGTYDISYDTYSYREVFPIMLNGVSMKSVNSAIPTVLDASLRQADVIEIQSAEPVTIQGLILQGALKSGLYIINSPNVTVTGNIFQYNAQGGIRTLQSNVQILSNTIENNIGGSGIKMEYSSGTISDNNIIDNLGFCGGGIYALKSNVNILNNVITDNVVRVEDKDAFGGGVCDIKSTATIQGNIISRNIVSSRYESYGGGIYCSSMESYSPPYQDRDFAIHGVVTIDNNQISQNSAKNGAGVCSQNLLNVNITQNDIMENAADEWGGGVYTIGGMPTITLNDILDNTASNGGGICCLGENAPEALIQGNNLIGNTASETGGGVLVARNYVQLSSNIFQENTAMMGGGLCLDTNPSTTTIFIQSCEFQKNDAQQDGGGIYSRYNTVYIEQCNFLENTANSEGGGANISKGTITRCTFENNVAQKYAAIIAYVGSNIPNQVLNCLLMGNTNNGGYGIVQADWVINNTFYNNSIVSGRGGDIEVAEGDVAINNIFSNTNNGYGVVEMTSNVKASIENNCFYKNSKGVYLDNDLLGYPNIIVLQDVVPEAINNISADPLFVSVFFKDFHLQSSSSCIDNGNNSFSGLPYNDKDNNIRPMGAGYDLGAYETQSTLNSIHVLGINDFTYFREGWRDVLPIMPFSTPNIQYELGKFTLTTTSNINSFGFITGAPGNLIWKKDYLYKITFKVNRQDSNPLTSPDFRFRLARLDNQIHSTVEINSRGNGLAVPALNGSIYTLYANPSQNNPLESGSATTAFDILNFDPGNNPYGSLQFDWIKFEEIHKSEVEQKFISIYQAEFPEDCALWTFSTAIEPFASITQIASAEGVGLSPGGNFYAFGFIESPVISAVGGKVYRLTATIGSNTQLAETTPCFRLRMFSVDNQVGGILGINSFGDSISAPAEGQDKKYEMYLVLPDSLNNPELKMGFDLVHFDPSDDSTSVIYLKSVKIDEAQQPIFAVTE